MEESPRPGAAIVRSLDEVLLVGRLLAQHLAHALVRQSGGSTDLPQAVTGLDGFDNALAQRVARSLGRRRAGLYPSERGGLVNAVVGIGRLQEQIVEAPERVVGQRLRLERRE